MTAAAIFIAIAGALFALKTLLSRRLATIALRTATQVDDAFVAVFGATNVLFIVVIALHAATSVLILPPGAVTTMRAVTIVAVALQFALWGGTGVRAFTAGYLLRHTESASRTAVFAVGFLAQAVIWSFVLVATLNAFGYDVTALVAGLGITGVAIALAVQNILGDLFAALSIVVDKPFVVGETIDVQGQVGTVERIGLKTTRVRALQGEEVVYANAELLKARLHNYSRMRERRLVTTLSVSYETPQVTVARIPAMIREAILAQPNVRFDRAHLTRLAESSLEFEYVFYSLDPDGNVGMDLKQAVYLALMRRFELEGVTLAYPTRVIIQRPQTPGAEPNEIRSELSRLTD
jgi:small-conductance mechanosensitive channel